MAIRLSRVARAHPGLRFGITTTGSPAVVAAVPPSKLSSGTEFAKSVLPPAAGVDSVDALRRLITQFSIDFNQRVRELEEFPDAQAVDRETEQQYFRPA